MSQQIHVTDTFMAHLAEFGADVARVGGSVRDEILERPAKDADYVVFGMSLSKLGAYLKMIDAQAKISPLKLRDGRQVGYRISRKGLGLIEVALPRKEISTGPGHRDFEIVTDPGLTAAEDAVRRDFTFNALYKWVGGGRSTAEVYGRNSQVLMNVEDPTGRGLYDLQHKLVHVTHTDSFRDDPLRTLRALRFVSTLGYDLTEESHRLMGADAYAVAGLNHNGNTSGTVLSEMSRMLMGDYVGKALRLMSDTGVMAVLFPELADMIGHEPASQYHDLTTDEHTIRAIEAAAKAGASLRVRWALLFHDAGKPDVEWEDDKGYKHYYAREPKEDLIDSFTGQLNLDHEEQSEYLWRLAAQRMNAPKRLREDVAMLIRHHMVTVQPRNVNVKVNRMRVKFGDDLTHDLLLHRVCDLSGKNKISKAALNSVTRQEVIRADAQAAGVPASIKDLRINGQDVMKEGAEGQQISRVLAAVLDDVVCQPDELRLSRAWQLGAATRWARKLT